MIINSKHTLSDMPKILPLLAVSKQDLLKECSKFEMPKTIQGVEPMALSKITILQQSWIWDIKDTTELLLAYCEIYFGITKKQSNWLAKCPLIDFYRFAYEVQKQSIKYAEELGNIQVELTDDEKKAGYGDKDPNGLLNMVYAMSNKKHISMEAAWNYPVVEYIFTFQNEAKESNRQRKYNKIISEKK